MKLASKFFKRKEILVELLKHHNQLEFHAQLLHLQKIDIQVQHILMYLPKLPK